MAFGLAAFLGLPALPSAAAPAAEVEGFSAIEAHHPIPGFEEVQTDAPAAHPAAASLKPGDVAGRYAILRAGGKDTGCILTLDTSKGQAGYTTVLSPACRDEGIVIFDPVGWQIADGSLVLTARKGHSTRLDHQADGTWTKEANEGKTLILKKVM